MIYKHSITFLLTCQKIIQCVLLEDHQLSNVSEEDKIKSYSLYSMKLIKV